MLGKRSKSATEAVGRTWWDVVAIAVNRIPSLAIALMVLVAVIAAVSIQAFVHLNADPGSKVTFLGLFEYQKGREPIDQLPSSYVVPEQTELPLSKGIAVLDQTVLVRVWPVGVSRRVVRLGGVNVAKLRVAARTHSAQPLAIKRVEETGELEISGPAECYLELRYDNRFFGISITRAQADHEYDLSMKQITKPSMELRAYQSH